MKLASTSELIDVITNQEDKIERLKELLEEAIDVIYFYENSLSHSHGGGDFLGDTPSSNRAEGFIEKYKNFGDLD